jgi:hypothetical protein
VVDDDGQVLLTFPVRYLIDPDAREAGQQVDPLPGVAGDAFADATDGPPGDPHQLRDRGL